ncbi:hypothetical protein C8J57DRAFT_1243106 [Mycena rebaudengoi]|nr:hypothetical protein C8J57DRAFT_1243106 [Mycena rebaudengoi]
MYLLRQGISMINSANVIRMRKTGLSPLLEAQIQHLPVFQSLWTGASAISFAEIDGPWQSRELLGLAQISKYSQLGPPSRRMDQDFQLFFPLLQANPNFRSRAIQPAAPGQFKAKSFRTVILRAIFGRICVIDVVFTRPKSLRYHDIPGLASHPTSIACVGRRRPARRRSSICSRIYLIALGSRRRGVESSRVLLPAKRHKLALRLMHPSRRIVGWTDGLFIHWPDPNLTQNLAKFPSTHWHGQVQDKKGVKKQVCGNL